MDAAMWDERYAAKDMVWSTEPNVWVQQVAEHLPSGTVLDLGAGEARNALWLAEKGWQATAVDFSVVAMERARDLAHRRLGEQADRLTTVTADLAHYAPDRTYDLVLVIYIHLQVAQRRAVLTTAAGAVSPGGQLLVVAHDLSNLTDGVGGPQDPAVLYTPEDVVADLAASGLNVVRAERVTRPVTVAAEQRTAFDALVLLRRAS